MFRVAVFVALLVPSAAPAYGIIVRVKSIDDKKVELYMKVNRLTHGFGSVYDLAPGFAVYRDGRIVPRSEIRKGDKVLVSIGRGGVGRIDLPSKPGMEPPLSPVVPPDDIRPKTEPKRNWIDSLEGFLCWGVPIGFVALAVLIALFSKDSDNNGSGGESFMERVRRIGARPPWHG